MVSGLITDSQITVSSHMDRNWVPENARLLTSRTGWTLPPPLANEWLQVDLGKEKTVNGLIIQGGNYRENKVFMKKFRLGYSSDGFNWSMVLDSKGNKPMVSFLWVTFAKSVPQIPSHFLVESHFLNSIFNSVLLIYHLLQHKSSLDTSCIPRG